LPGELEGHTLSDNLVYFAVMGELEEAEEAGLVDGTPAWLISPAVEPGRLGRLFRRRG
jgi:hypothetical protein